jgi:hypothetical protein
MKSFFFLIHFLLISFAFVRPVFAADPIVDRVDVVHNNERFFQSTYSPFSNKNLVKIIVQGKNIQNDQIFLDMDVCDDTAIREPKNDEDFVYFACLLNEFPDLAQDYPGKIMSQESGKILMSFVFHYKPVVYVSYRSVNTLAVNYGSSSFEKFEALVEGQNISPETIYLDYGCLDDEPLSRIDYENGKTKLFKTCKSDKFYRRVGVLRLVREIGKNGKIIAIDQSTESAFSPKYLKTVYPIHHEGYSEIIIHSKGLGEDVLKVLAAQCQSIRWIPNIYSDDSGVQNYICDWSGQRGPAVDEIKVVYSSSKGILNGQQLWPVLKQGIFLVSNNSYYSVFSDERIVTGEYLRNLHIPDRQVSVDIDSKDGGKRFEVDIHILRPGQKLSFESNWCQNFGQAHVLFVEEAWSKIQCSNSPDAQENSWSRVVDVDSGDILFQQRHSKQSQEQINHVALNYGPHGRLGIYVRGQNLPHKEIKIIAPWCLSQDLVDSQSVYAEIECETSPGAIFQYSDIKIVSTNKVLWPVDISKAASKLLSDEPAVETPQSLPADSSNNAEAEKTLPDLTPETSLEIMPEPKQESKEPVSKSLVNGVTSFQQPKDLRQILISISGENLPKSMVVFVPECDAMKTVEFSATKAQYTCRFFPTALSKDYSAFVKTDTKSNGGLMIESGDFVVSYEAPPAYVVRLLYPTEREGYKIYKNAQQDAFIYFSLSDYHLLDEDLDSYSFTYQVGGKVYNIGSQQLPSLDAVNWAVNEAAYGGNGLFALKVPATVTSGSLLIKEINGDDELLGYKTIQIALNDLSSANLLFSRDRSLGLKAKLNPWLALGGGKDNGGSLQVEVPYAQKISFPLDLKVGIEHGWQAESTIGIQNKKVNANVSGNVKWIARQAYDLTYKSFQDYAGVELYDLYGSLILAYQKAILEGETYESCRGSLGYFFSAKECLLSENYQKSIADFQSVVNSINKKILPDKTATQNAMALFLVLKEGFGLKGNKAFEDAFFLLNTTLQDFKREDAEDYLQAHLLEEASSVQAGAGVNAGIALGLVDAGLGAKINGVWEEEMRNGDPDGITRVERVTQGSEIDTSFNLRAPGASQLLQRWTSEVFSRAVSKVLTRVKSVFPQAGEDVACRILKAIMSQEGILTPYSDDCRGLYQVMVAAGFNADLKVDTTTIQDAFEKVVGIKPDETTVKIISALFLGVQVDILDAILSDYPSKKAITMAKYYLGNTLKRVVFTIRYEKASKVYQDEYTFAMKNGVMPHDLSEAFFLSQQLEQYLKVLRSNSNTDFSMSRFQLMPVSESDLKLDLGWGVKFQYNEKMGHELKIPYQSYVFDLSGNVIQSSQLAVSASQAFVSQLNSLADKNGSSNLHIETIMRNLYQIILTRVGGYYTRGLVVPLE